MQEMRDGVALQEKRDGDALQEMRNRDTLLEMRNGVALHCKRDIIFPPMGVTPFTAART